jgi:hypothetical protein
MGLDNIDASQDPRAFRIREEIVMPDRQGDFNVASIEEVEKLLSSMERNLSHMRVVIDDIEFTGKDKLRMQSWDLGVEADRLLASFVRSLEADE